MYIREVFDETDLDRLHGLIEAYSFGMLINNDDTGPFVSHLPFMLDRTDGPNGTLHFHMARANPQWQNFDGEVLALFRGPHSYISPTWYEPLKPAVPTWNYAVVHAYGRPRRIEDPAALHAHQERLATMHETGRSPAWQMSDQPDKYIEGMLKGIVAFEIPISRLHGKFKMSQDRSSADQTRVADALGDSGTEDGAALARLMRQR